MNESPSSPPPSPGPESEPHELEPGASSGAGNPGYLARPPLAPPPGGEVLAGDAPPPAVEYGGFWIRFAAYIIDGLLLGLVGLVLGIAFGLGSALAGGSGVDPAAQSLVSLLNLAISVGYFAWFWVRSGSTPGMAVLGLQVVREADGGQIGIGAALVRYVGIILSTLALFIGLIWVAFDSRKRGWHDMLAGTVVIRKPDVPMTGGRRAVMIGAIGCGCLLPIVAILAIVALLLTGPALQDIFGDVADDFARGSDGQIEQPVALPYGSLRVGDCFELLDPDSPSITIVQAVPCADEHVYEVFFVGDMPDGEFPGDDAVAAFADQNCLPAFEAYVGVAFEESTWFASPVGPAEEDWAAGTRRVTCQLHTQDEVRVTGSARDSGE
jgi:uncharacterized RDD family membrane protein YckC